MNTALGEPVDIPSPEAPLQAIAGFVALLRDHGFRVGIAEQHAMVRVTLLLGPARWRRLDACWRALACQDRRDWDRWPELFQRYWFPHRVRGTTRVSGTVRPSRSLQQVVQALQERLAEGPPGSAGRDTALQPGGGLAEEQAGRRAQGGASRADPLHDRSAGAWLPQDLRQLELLVARVARQLRLELTRRWRDRAEGRRLDLRRTLRASLGSGGVPLHPAWRARRRERPRVFILVDVSRSMETHAQLFLRIARAFVAALDARVFVFHTRLAEVTALLRGNSASIQEKVNAVTAGFGGGTCIATSLADFHQVHARAQLGRRARVWLLSDGFDADPPHRLGEELLRIRRRGARILWFHPSSEPPASAAVRALQGTPHAVQSFLRLASVADLMALPGLL